ncbi:MAG: serine protease, partial [Candidatus Thiodiazotropha endolucinida]
MRCSRIRNISWLTLLIALIFSESVFSRGDGSAEEPLQNEQGVGHYPYAYEKLINYYPDTNPLRKIGRGLVYIKAYGKNKKTWPCSGFKVADDLVLTAAHCTFEPKTSRQAVKYRVHFDYLNDPLRNVQWADASLTDDVDYYLDYAFLQLDVSSDAVKAREGVNLPVSASPIQEGFPHWLFHHPGFRQPAAVSREECMFSGEEAKFDVEAPEVADPKVGDIKIPEQYVLIKHSCDSNSGSSGAPITNLHGEVVALHVGYRDGTDNNLAVRIGDIKIKGKTLNTVFSNQEKGVISLAANLTLESGKAQKIDNKSIATPILETFEECVE